MWCKECFDLLIKHHSTFHYNHPSGENPDSHVLEIRVHTHLTIRNHADECEPLFPIQYAYKNLLFIAMSCLTSLSLALPKYRTHPPCSGSYSCKHTYCMRISVQWHKAVWACAAFPELWKCIVQRMYTQSTMQGHIKTVTIKDKFSYQISSKCWEHVYKLETTCSKETNSVIYTWCFEPYESFHTHVYSQETHFLLMTNGY